jgi:hypothetical protein
MFRNILKPTTPVSCADSCAGKRNSSCMRGCKVRNTASKRQGFRATPAPNTHCESRSSSGWQRRLNANHGHAVYATDGDPWLKERFLEGSSGDDVVSVIFQQHLLSPLPINRSVDVGVCASRSHCEGSMRFAGVFETGHRRSCAGQSKPSPVEICDVLAPKSVQCVRARFARQGKRIMDYSQRGCFESAKFMARPNNVMWFARGFLFLVCPRSRLPISERQLNTACPGLPLQGCWFFLPQRRSAPALFIRLAPFLCLARPLASLQHSHSLFDRDLVVCTPYKQQAFHSL